MKKILLFLTTTALLLVFTAAQVCGQVIISQYYEGSSNNKWIEITNVGTSSVDLTSPQQYLCLYSNAAADDPANNSPNNSQALTGTLTAGQVILFRNSSAVLPSYASGTSTAVCLFNGDDLIIISSSNGATSWADRFDVIGNGTSWGANTSFYRNSDITSANTTYTASEWTEVTNSAVDNATSGNSEYLGTHIYISGPDNPASFSATASSASQIDLAFASNAATDNVVIAYNGTGTFTAPSGAPPTVGQAFAGGTLLYNGTTSPQNHTGLTANETVYYKAWSYDNTDYSTGLTDDATTYASEPSSHPTAFSATSNSSSEITVAWTDAASTEHYLIKGSDVSYAAIVAPTDGVAESNSSLVQNVAQGVETHQFTSLSASTTYYFKIYPYNGTGTGVNYKTDETVLEDDATTDAYSGPALLISEVADPNNVANAKFIELYNAGASTIDFDADTWYISRQANGGTWNDLLLTGSIATGETFVVAYLYATPPNYDSEYGVASNMSSGYISGNGDDGYFLYKDADHTTGTLVDAYGVIDEDGTGQPWEYTDSKAVRKNTVTEPNTTWTALEWTIVSSCDAARMTPAMHPASAWNGEAAKSSVWTTIGNWDNGLTASGISAHIPSGLTVYPTLTASATIEDLRMGSGATLLGGENLTIDGSAAVQKTIAEYTSNTDGWNVISVPVNGMAMAGSDFVPVVDEDDLYAYDQAENIWRNYHDIVNPAAWFDYFDVGTGYLVAYATDNGGIKNFVGALNTDASYAVSISNSNTAWDLIGNPYPSNITWADVTLTNASSPKVINTSTGAWDDLGTILETGQGIFVYAEGGGANVTFARADQTHTAPTKKAMTTDQVKFIADFGGKSVSLALIVNETATQSYEWQYDARYLYPVTTIPYLCAITEDDVWVSKYAFGSQNLETTIIPLFFQVSNEQSITFSLDNFSKEIGVAKITLEDKSNGNLTVLTNGDNYTYQASPDDQTDRFILHVETVTSIYEITQLEGVSIYGYNNNIYIRSELNTPAKVLVYNMFGQEVYHSSMELNGLQSFNLNAKTGWYIVQVVAEMGVKTEKVFVK